MTLVTILTTIEVSIAGPIPVMPAPSVRLNAHIMTAPLMIRENRPNVRNVTGRDMNFSTGFTNILSTASAKAAATIAVLLVKLTCENRPSAMNNATQSAINVLISFFILRNIALFLCESMILNESYISCRLVRISGFLIWYIIKSRKQGRMRRKSHKIVKICIAVIAAAVLLGLCFFVILPYLHTGKSNVLPAANHYEETMPEENPEIPEYTGEAVTIINENEPSFTEYPEVTETYLHLSEFDEEGRCGTAEALLGPETIPDQPRGSIGMIRPSGWKTVRYDDLIEDKYLYNRCHLIAYELCGDNDPRQLITGTRYMNIAGMLAYENMTADYIRSTGNHVLYRSVPVFIDDELVCRGILLEAVSLEDHGEGLKFCVFCHNVQPGVEIEYLTGDSRRTEEITRSEPAETDYIINIRTLRFHYPDCDGVRNMKEKNKKAVHADRETLIQEGYIPCGSCNP